MDFKENINKIHSDLVINFTDVKVQEKSSLKDGEYVEITTLNEGKELVILIQKRELNSKTFNWKYYSNPDKRDYLVERKSELNTLIDDVKDIFNKKRFDSEYVNSTSK